MVSVVITTYGRNANIVMRAVDSVKKQTYANWELFVVDDNKDNNPYSQAIKAALENEENTKIHYIKMEKNSGACVARNRGIQESKGEYIAFLDDDDEWLPERLEKQLPLIKDEKVGFTYCGVWILNEKKGKKTSSWIKFDQGHVYDKLLKTNFMGGVSNFIVKRRAVEVCGGFRDDMPSSQDYELWLRLSKKYEVNSIAENLVVFHIHEGDSIMKSYDRRIAGYRKILESYHEDIIKNKKTHSYQLYNLGKFLILNHENKEGFSWLGKAIKMYPPSAIYYIGVIIYWKMLRTIFH